MLSSFFPPQVQLDWPTLPLRLMKLIDTDYRTFESLGSGIAIECVLFLCYNLNGKPLYLYFRLRTLNNMRGCPQRIDRFEASYHWETILNQFKTFGGRVV